MAFTIQSVAMANHCKILSPNMYNTSIHWIGVYVYIKDISEYSHQKFSLLLFSSHSLDSRCRRHRRCRYTERTKWMGGIMYKAAATFHL